jgi:hypothetical protein
VSQDDRHRHRSQVEYSSRVYERDLERARRQREAQLARYNRKDRRGAKGMCVRAGCAQAAAPSCIHCDDCLQLIADQSKARHVRRSDRAAPRCRVCVAMGANGEGHTARNHDRAMRMAEKAKGR